MQPEVNIFGISGIITFVTCIIVGIFVYIKNQNNFTNRLWAYLLLATSLWGLSSYKVSTTSLPNEAAFWWKFGHLGVIFIPAIFFHFVCSFLRIKKYIFLRASYLISLFFLIALLSGNLIKEMEWVFNSFYYHRPYLTNILYDLFFLIWLSIFSYSYLLLIINYRLISDERREQIKYFFLTTLIGFIGGIGCFLPVFGVNLYPYGNIAVTLFPITTTYVILKHKLLNINIVFKKGLVYSAILTLITLFYLIIVSISEKYLQQSVGYKSILPSILVTFLVGLLFVPLRNRIQYLIDKMFFKGSHIEIAEENELLRKEIFQSERLKSISILASGIAHEIKNPLTPLKTFSEYLPQKINDKEFLNKFAPIINREVNRIDALVHELLDFAKPAPLTLRPTEIHRLLNNILEFLSNDFFKHNIHVIKDYCKDKVIVSLDSNQFKQALLNILLNSVDAMPTGGEIKILTTLLPNSMLIKIHDTGTGIASDHLTHVFDPFFTKKDHGTGLGLSITHEIIKNHNGKIFVESKQGSGTTFIIELPYNSPL
jgi:signal transduction histidine kinase